MRTAPSGYPDSRGFTSWTRSREQDREIHRRNFQPQTARLPLALLPLSDLLCQLLPIPRRAWTDLLCLPKLVLRREPRSKNTTANDPPKTCDECANSGSRRPRKPVAETANTPKRKREPQIPQTLATMRATGPRPWRKRPLPKARSALPDEPPVPCSGKSPRRCETVIPFLEQRT